jgi:hypothetical protein
LAFHRDERGVADTLASVMKLAVAAIVVVALIAFGQSGIDFLKEMGSKIFSSDAIK